jgi:peptidoglycan/LPS O-acetylase OafA/YrhL
MDKKSQVTVIEPLRGFAALAVCWFHFTNGQGLLPDGWLRSSGSFGWLGVECFFVISGFVIPLSMYSGKFKFLVDWKIFFGKRFLRLEPPYLVSILLTAGLWQLSSIAPGFAGKPPNISFLQFFAHLGYVNAFLGYDWINPVYWTLAIEFQYYVIISLFYFLIASPNKKITCASTLGLAALSFLPISGEFVLHFMVLFAFGIVTFQQYVGLISRKVFYIQMLLLSAISVGSLGFIITGIGISTALLIAFVRFPVPKLISFLGMISYSIYLIHVPVGGRIVNLGKRFAHTLPTQILVLLCAFAVTILSAYIMYYWIERPAKIWSSSLKYILKDDVKIAS